MRTYLGAEVNDPNFYRMQVSHNSWIIDKLKLAPNSPIFANINLIDLEYLTRLGHLKPYLIDFLKIILV